MYASLVTRLRSFGTFDIFAVEAARATVCNVVRNTTVAIAPAEVVAPTVFLDTGAYVSTRGISPEMLPTASEKPES